MTNTTRIGSVLLGAALLWLGSASTVLGEAAPGPGERLRPALHDPSLDRAGLARACLVAAAEAEALLGLPAGLLAAIAVVESAAHAFAVGTPARSHYAANRVQAVRLARASGPRAAGGCFQINLPVHAGRDPAWVFDPWASALFAGRLVAHHAAAAGGDWGLAVARYAGAGPGSEAAQRQRCRVAAGLAGLGQALPRGLSASGCNSADHRVWRAKAALLAARARGPEAVASLR